jgi:hypothetical protein
MELEREMKHSFRYRKKIQKALIFSKHKVRVEIFL